MRRRDRLEREPAVRRRSHRRCARSGRSQSTGTLDYNGLLVKFQRRFANDFSFLNSYTYGKAIDLNSDNDGTVTLTNVYDPRLQPRAGRLRHHAHPRVELDLRAAVGRSEQVLRRLAGQRHRLLAHGPALHAVTRRRASSRPRPAAPDSART